MTHQAIIEAAARAVCRIIYTPEGRWHNYAAEGRAVLAAVTPLIRAAALEEAAKEAEDCVTGEDAAYNIRLLKEQP